MKMGFETNPLNEFHICKLNNLKVIHHLYPNDSFPADCNLL
jgi:hypothetical protein